MKRTLHVTRAQALGTLGALTAAAAAPPVFAAGKERVNVAVGAEHAMVYLPWDLAKALGYFDQEGLDVNLFYTKGGTEAAQALVSGSVEFSGNAIDHAIAAQAQGKSLVMIADFMNQPGLVLLVRSADRDKYRTMRDLKGKTVGVTTIGAATHVIAIWLAHRAGLGKDDLKIVGVGGGPTMPAALNGGRVDAAFGNDPFATQLIRTGQAHAMIDLFRPSVVRELTGFRSYAFTGALTRGDVIQKKPETVQKMVNALVRAQKFMARHSAQQVAAALPDEMRVISAADWAPGFSHSRPAYTNHGEISAEGVHAVVETNVYFGDTAGGGKTDEPKLFDNAFVEKANRSVKV